MRLLKACRIWEPSTFPLKSESHMKAFEAQELKTLRSHESMRAASILQVAQNPPLDPGPGLVPDILSAAHGLGSGPLLAPTSVPALGLLKARQPPWPHQPCLSWAFQWQVHHLSPILLDSLCTTLHRQLPLQPPYQHLLRLQPLCLLLQHPSQHRQVPPGCSHHARSCPSSGCSPCAYCGNTPARRQEAELAEYCKFCKANGITCCMTQPYKVGPTRCGYMEPAHYNTCEKCEKLHDAAVANKERRGRK